VLGHEFIGTVVEADDAVWVGKRVVADINAGCGTCQDCRERDGHHCASRTVLGIFGRGGAIADRLAVPERCLVEVPDGLSDDRAVFAEPLAAALHVLDVLGDGERRAIVLGDGKLGLLIALALVQDGVDTTLVGHHEDKLSLAVGATTCLENELAEAVSAPVVVEATGTETGLARAIGLCAPRGTLVLKSTIAGGHAVDLSPVVINELSVVGSRCGDMGAAVTCLAAGRVDPTPLIAARYPLDQADAALAHAARRGTLKVLVDA
jgi:threonine dehydrogenase-like Zn-dependent dehydrogenase